MKQALKLIGSLIAGGCFGLGIAYIGLYIATGMPLDDFLEKFAAIGLPELGGVVIMAVLFATLAFYLQIILHEAGHLVCGLATGYRFVSFRILSLTLIRQEGKLRIKRFGIAGTGGQCLLTPPDLPLEEIPCTLYNLGGVLANLLAVLLSVALLLGVEGLPHPLELFLLMMALFGTLLLAMNGIPMKIGGISNDAENMRLLRKDLQSKRAMVVQLRANALVQEGMRPREMPAGWFEEEGKRDYRNALLVTVRLMRASRLQDNEEWEKAYEALEEIEAHREEIIGLLVNETECELMFTAWVTQRTERAEQLCSDRLLTYIQRYKKVMSSKQRILCALALYRDKDAARAKEIYEELCLRQADYLMQGEVRSDIALMQSMLTQANVL